MVANLLGPPTHGKPPSTRGTSAGRSPPHKPNNKRGRPLHRTAEETDEGSSEPGTHQDTRTGLRDCTTRGQGAGTTSPGRPGKAHAADREVGPEGGSSGDPPTESALPGESTRRGQEGSHRPPGKPQEKREHPEAAAGAVADGQRAKRARRAPLRFDDASPPVPLRPPPPPSDQGKVAGRRTKAANASPQGRNGTTPGRSVPTRGSAQLGEVTLRSAEPPSLRRGEEGRQIKAQPLFWRARRASDLSSATSPSDGGTSVPLFVEGGVANPQRLFAGSGFIVGGSASQGVGQERRPSRNARPENARQTEGAHHDRTGPLFRASLRSPFLRRGGRAREIGLAAQSSSDIYTGAGVGPEGEHMALTPAARLAGRGPERATPEERADITSSEAETDDRESPLSEDEESSGGYVVVQITVEPPLSATSESPVDVPVTIERRSASPMPPIILGDIPAEDLPQPAGAPQVVSRNSAGHSQLQKNSHREGESGHLQGQHAEANIENAGLNMPQTETAKESCAFKDVVAGLDVGETRAGEVSLGRAVEVEAEDPGLALAGQATKTGAKPPEPPMGDPCAQNTDAADAQAQMTKLSAENAELKTALSRAQAESSAIKGQLEGLQEQNKGLCRQATASLGKVAELESDDIRLQGQATAALSRLAQYEAERVQLTGQATSIANKMAQLQAQVGEFAADKRALSESIARLEEEREREGGGRVAQLEASVAELSAEKQELSVRITSLDEENERLSGQATAACLRAAEADQQREAIANELASLQLRVDQAERDVTELSEERDLLNARIMSLEGANDCLLGEARSARERVEGSMGSTRVPSDAKDAEEQGKKWASEALGEALKSKAAINRENEALKREVAELKRAKEESASLIGQTTTSLAEVVDLRARLEALSAESGRLKQENRALTAEVSGLKTAKDEVQKDRDNLERQLAAIKAAEQEAKESLAALSADHQRLQEKSKAQETASKFLRDSARPLLAKFRAAGVGASCASDALADPDILQSIQPQKVVDMLQRLSGSNAAHEAEVKQKVDEATRLMEAKLAAVQAHLDAEHVEAREARRNESHARAAAVHWKEQATLSTSLLQQSREQIVAAKDMVTTAAKRLQDLTARVEQGEIALRDVEVQLETVKLQRDESSGENARLLQKLLVREEETKHRASRHS